VNCYDYQQAYLNCFHKSFPIPTLTAHKITMPTYYANKAACYEVKMAKYNFERKLAENIKNDTKSFYAYM